MSRASKVLCKEQVWKNKKLSLTKEIFREINSLVKSKKFAFTKFLTKSVR